MLTFMWARNMMLMQVCHVTKQRFHSFNIGNSIYYLGTVTFITIWTVSIYLYLNNFSKENIYSFFILAAIVQFLVLMEFIVSFLNQAKHILGIKLFKINPPA